MVGGCFGMLTFIKDMIKRLCEFLFKGNMKFECYRYFFSSLFSDDARKSFAEVINSKTDIEFKIKNTEYFYRFLESKQNVTLGLFAKKGQVNLKPDKTLDEKPYPDYIECFVVFNTNAIHENDENSQTIYIQTKDKFASDNLKPLNKFARAISSDISINPINKEKVFWDAIKNNIVKKLTLEVSPSNLFGHKNALVEEADYVRKKRNAKKYKTTIETDDEKGLNLNDPEEEFKEGLHYCMSGGGGVVAIGVDGKTALFDSKEKITLTTKKIEIDASKLTNKDRELYLEIIDKFLDK